jgi:hypothetical protein
MSRYIAVFQEHAPDPPAIYDLDELSERAGVLEIHLRGEGQRRLTLSFSEHLAFRKADEGDSLATLNAMSSTSQTGRSFYLVEDSEYLRWFVEQSYSVRQAESLTHIMIATIDDIIDVLTLQLPSIVIP